MFETYIEGFNIGSFKIDESLLPPNFMQNVLKVTSLLQIIFISFCSREFRENVCFKVLKNLEEAVIKKKGDGN